MGNPDVRPNGGSVPAQAGLPMSGKPDMNFQMPQMDDLSKALQEVSYLNSALGSLLAQDKPPKRDDVFQIASSLVNEGILSPQDVAKQLVDFPAKGSDIMPWVKAKYEATENQLQSILGLISMSGQGAQSGAAPMGQPAPIAPQMPAGGAPTASTVEG